MLTRDASGAGPDESENARPGKAGAGVLLRSRLPSGRHPGGGRDPADRVSAVASSSALSMSPDSGTAANAGASLVPALTPTPLPAGEGLYGLRARVRVERPV